MDIKFTRLCNEFNIKAVEKYFDAPEGDFSKLYQELLDDKVLLSELNKQIEKIRIEKGFNKAIFKNGAVDTLDWFAFERILIYILIRFFKPARIIETGVFYGGNTVFALAAIGKNDYGILTSIDYPSLLIKAKNDDQGRHQYVGDSENYNFESEPGFIIPEYLKKNWQLIIGDSLVEIPKLNDKFDFYIHDSEHSMEFLSNELNLVWSKLNKKAIILVDDIDWSNAFSKFVVEKRLFPILLTDNGKDNLRVRIGLAYTGHKNNYCDCFN